MTIDPTDVETYVRASVCSRNGVSIESAVQLRDNEGKLRRELARKLIAMTREAADVCGGAPGEADDLEATKYLRVLLEKEWPDRFYFIEAWTDTAEESDEGWIQCYQPAGRPIHRRRDLLALTELVRDMIDVPNGPYLVYRARAMEIIERLNR